MKIVGGSGEGTKVSFYSRKNNTRSVFVEGFANRFKDGEKLLVDRGNDLIEPKAWNLDNFQTNGIILFNHDKDNPVGRAVKIEVNEDGLFVKAKISDSAHPEVSRIRDLVKDGVLRAFSVGFNPKAQDEEDVEGKSVNVIKDAELLEISIVSLPMAERSLFNVSAKALADLPYDVAKKACMGELNVYEDDGETQTPKLVEVVNKLKQADGDEGTEIPPDEAAEIIDSQPKEAATSPLLDQVKQTNILLSNLISEIKLMSQKMDKAGAQKVEVEEEEEEEEEKPDAEEEEEKPKKEGEEEEEEDAEEEEEEEEDSKKLKLVDDLHSHCDKILRKHGY
mgnify:CR=1 FL=1